MFIPPYYWFLRDFADIIATSIKLAGVEHMCIIAWSMVGIIGLAVSFSGAFLFALKGVKSRNQILAEGTPRIPSLPAGPETKEDMQRALLKIPAVQALIRQSKIARIGVWVLAIGFLLQFSSALALFLTS